MGKKYSASCAIWYTSDGIKIYHPVTVESDWIERFNGLEGLLDKYTQDNMDPTVWKCPVFPVTKHGKHHGYYYYVNGIIGRCSFVMQGESSCAKKCRLKHMNQPHAK